MTGTTTIRSLDELCALLNAAPSDEREALDYARDHGLPTGPNGIGWADLPTFGGAEPSDTGGVWSWDATRLLVTSAPLAGLEAGNALRNASTGFRLVPRPDAE